MRWIVALILACLAVPAAAQTFINPSAIDIPDQGAAQSVISVSGLQGLVSSVSVTLNDVTHTFANDLVFGLVSERAAIGLIFWSEAGGSYAVDHQTLTFTDAATAFLPATVLDNAAITAGSYLPSNWGGYGFNGIANAILFSDFNGINPNGEWRLLAYDQTAGDVGSVAGGWSLNFTTMGTGGPVPEPASWALLIGGFALAGGALRRQRGPRATIATA